MNVLIVTDKDLDAINVVNDVQAGKRSLTPQKLPDGRRYLSADLLTDCHVGQTWADYREALLSLSVEDVVIPEPPDDG